MISANGAAGSVLSLGRIYCDMVFTGLDGLPRLGRECFADDFALVPGGGALITAAHLQALGRRASLVARLGTDPLSRALEAPIGELGLDLDFLERHANAGPQLTVAMVEAGERAFLSRRAGTARPAGFEASLISPGVRHLHIAEYATLHEMPDALASAKARGLSVSLDPSWDDTLIHDPVFFERTAGVDIFLPNLEEAEALTGTRAPKQALAQLQRHFPVVALKCGGDGALLGMGEEIVALPSPRVDVIDTTGAGDAFNAGFLHAWLNEAGAQACLAAAIAAGSRSVQAAGGIGALRAAE